MQQTVDFLPERIKVQRARRQRLVTQGYLLALCVAALAVVGYMRQGRINLAGAELRQTTKHTENVQTRLSILNSLEHQQAELMIKKRISDHLGSRVRANDVLAELQRLLPESMALTSLDMETMHLNVSVSRAGKSNVSARAVSASAKNPRQDREVRRVRLELTGLAPTDVGVANFIGQLSASKLFEDVTMGYAKNVDFRGRSAREFRASCYVVR